LGKNIIIGFSVAHSWGGSVESMSFIGGERKTQRKGYKVKENRTSEDCNIRRWREGGEWP